MKVRFNSFALLISILTHSSFHAEELHMLLYKSLHNMPIPSFTVNADAHSKKSKMQTIFSQQTNKKEIKSLGIFSKPLTECSKSNEQKSHCLNTVESTEGSKGLLASFAAFDKSFLAVCLTFHSIYFLKMEVVEVQTPPFFLDFLPILG